MAKKIKKKVANHQERDFERLTQPQVAVAEQEEKLDDVTQDQSFEINVDEEDMHQPVVFIDHYRKAWGDDFDADIDKGFTVAEIKDLIVYLLHCVDVLEKKQLVLLQTQQGNTHILEKIVEGRVDMIVTDEL